MKLNLESLRWRFKFWYASHEAVLKCMSVSMLFYIGGVVAITIPFINHIFVRIPLVFLYCYVYVFACHKRVCEYVLEHRRVKYGLAVSGTFLNVCELYKSGVEVVWL